MFGGIQPFLFYPYQVFIKVNGEPPGQPLGKKEL